MCCVIYSNLGPGMTYAVATTSERVRTDKSDHCACARMRDMRLDESWTGRIWDHHSGTHAKMTSCFTLTGDPCQKVKLVFETQLVWHEYYTMYIYTVC